MVVNDSSCAYSEVTLAARLVSKGSYSTVSAGAVRASEADVAGGRGNCCSSSRPLTLMEVDAVVKVFVMYCHLY